MVERGQILRGDRLAEYFREGVQKAALGHNLQLSETTEFYLVSLLAGFERTECLFTLKEDRFEEEPLAVMFARAVNGDAASQVKGLKRLGDVALYTTGFFSERLQRGFVGKKYYIEMGSSAYALLAGRFASDDLFLNLYSELSDYFPELAKVIGELSISEEFNSNIELLRLYERWLKTGDEAVRKRLVEEGIVLTSKKISC